MSDPVGRWIFLQILFAVLSAFCSLAAYAMRECSESKLLHASEDGDKKAAKMLPYVQEPDDFCAAMRVGTVGFGFFAVYNGLTRKLADLLTGLLPAAADGIGVLLWIVLALIAVALLDYAPERYAMQRADAAARSVFAPAMLLYRLIWPVAKVLLVLSGLVLRLFGINPNAEVEEVSEDEIRLMVETGEESGAIQTGEKEMIENIFEFDDLTVEDIMVHRTDMEVLRLDESEDSIVRTIVESGLSRFPVCGEDVDDIRGIVNTREYLLNARQSHPKSLVELLRPAHFVPESVKADVLLRDMQKQKVHMSIVVDEYGGTSGLVTMEDLLEQLVGEIYDEFDAVEEQDLSRIGENLWRVAGAADLSDVFEALGLELPEEEEDEIDTMAGLVFSRLSVIPADGAHPEVDALGLHLRVEDIREHRIEWITVSKLPRPEDPSEE